MLYAFSDFGAACWAGSRDWSHPFPGTAPRGLSAVSENSGNWLVALLAVIAFPPLVLVEVGTAFRRPAGTVRSSDFSRLVVISLLVLDDYRHRAEAERSRWVRT
jgi:hypothetical protein